MHYTADLHCFNLLALGKYLNFPKKLLTCTNTLDLPPSMCRRPCWVMLRWYMCHLVHKDLTVCYICARFIFKISNPRTPICT